MLLFVLKLRYVYSTSYATDSTRTDFVVRFQSIEYVISTQSMSPTISPSGTTGTANFHKQKTSNDVDFIYDNDNLFLQFYVSICPAQETVTLARSIGSIRTTTMTMIPVDGLRFRKTKQNESSVVLSGGARAHFQRIGAVERFQPNNKPGITCTLQ